MALKGCRSHCSPYRNTPPDAVNHIGEDEAARSAQRPPPINGSGSSLAASLLLMLLPLQRVNMDEDFWRITKLYM